MEELCKYILSLALSFVTILGICGYYILLGLLAVVLWVQRHGQMCGLIEICSSALMSEAGARVDVLFDGHPAGDRPSGSGSA